MVAVAEAISTTESRERFLRSGLRNFRAGALIEKSGASAQSVDQDSEPRIWNLEGTERAAIPGMALHWLR